MNNQSDTSASNSHTKVRDFAVKLLDACAPLKKGASNFLDDPTFMGMHFLYKQTQHLDGILRLGSHRDAPLILRTMLEGWGYLRWTDGDTNRATDWRAYVGVGDFELAKENLANGQEIPKEAKDWLDNWIDEHSDRFLKKGAREKIADGLDIWELKAPFRNKWCKSDFRQVLESFKHGLFYSDYKKLSEWQHWSPRSFSNSFHVEQDTWAYVNEATEREQAWCLFLGSLCLVQSALIVSNWMGRTEIQGDLSSLQDELLSMKSPDGT